MAEGFAAQASFKFGPGLSHMLNVRGETVQEFAENCGLIEQIVSSVTQLGELFTPATVTEDQAIRNVQDGLGGQVVGKTCVHGAMLFKEGTSRAGKPWKAFMCPSLDKNKCDPVWV